MKWLRKFLGRMTPEDLHYEQVELIVLAARRCTHDLEHATSYIAPGEEHDLFRERVHMWRKVFYPAGDGKNYRHRLHYEIDELSAYADRLEAELEKHGIKHNCGDPRVPF